jgi:hypothetical protein
MEGVGHVAAYDAISEALSMIEQPSEFTPESGDTQGSKSEILMLWVTESTPSASVLKQHPSRQLISGQVLCVLCSVSHGSVGRST